MLAQKMVTEGVEVIFGATTDPAFGPLLMFGLGGIFVETVRDVVFRLHPLTDLDAKEMIEGIKGYPILRGIRGKPGADQDALGDILLRVDRLLGDFPEILELDINPVMAGPPGKGAMAVDGRIRLKDLDSGK